MGSGKRILLLAVAVLLSASALLAIGILLVGHFGRTEGRILATTALLAAYGLLALPSTILLDQRRSRRLAVIGLSLPTVGASLALVALWTSNPSATLGNAVGTVTAFALASTQASALAAGRRERDPTSVRRLYAFSSALAATAAAMFTALLWAQIERESYVRLLAALVVLDLLLVALQPILARARPLGARYRLRVLVEPDETVVLEVEAPDLATAASKAIRALERDDRVVLGLEVGERTFPRTSERQMATSGSIKP